MGCDIHFYVEKFSNEDYDGPIDPEEHRNDVLEEILEDGEEKEARWISADKWLREEYEEDEIYWDVTSDFYYSRNYYVFAILAGVRGEETPISNPRGVPEDASFGYRYKVNDWQGDAHSHSYYTLKELMEVDWESLDDQYNSLGELRGTVEKMKLVDPDPEKVRCCFFFDN